MSLFHVWVFIAVYAMCRLSVPLFVLRCMQKNAGTCNEDGAMLLLCHYVEAGYSGSENSNRRNDEAEYNLYFI